MTALLSVDQVSAILYRGSKKSDCSPFSSVPKAKVAPSSWWSALRPPCH